VNNLEEKKQTAFGALVEAWKNRGKMGEYRRQIQMLEFVPAALEIQDKPPSPLGRKIAYILILLFVIAIAWAALGKINIVAVAEGKIISSGRIKQIQPLDKGIVKTIYVSEGQTVNAGDPLIELDQTFTSADSQKHQREYQYLVNTLVRERQFVQLLQPERIVNEKKQPTQSQISTASFVLDIEHPLDKQAQENLLKEQWQDYQSRLAALHSQRDSRLAEQQVNRALINKLKGTLPLVSKRVSALKTLMNKKLGSEAQYLELEQERVEQQQDLVAERARAKQLAASLQEIDHQIQALATEQRLQALQRIDQNKEQLAGVEQELNKSTALNNKQIITAPVDGKVQQLAVHTIGGIVTPAQLLMNIVPEQDHLEVEAMLQNKDVGFVSKGLKAEIKVNTFPFTKYGVVDAEVVNITADAVEDERQGLVYTLRLKMDDTQLYVENQWVDLLPGMLVSAEVKTGSRRVIEYFLAPLLRYKQESIRER